jgi:hypothetical protein
MRDLHWRFCLTKARMRLSRLAMLLRRAFMSPVFRRVPQADVPIPRSLVILAAETGMPASCNRWATCLATPGRLNITLDFSEMISPNFFALSARSRPVSTATSSHMAAVPWMTEERSSTQLSTE